MRASSFLFLFLLAGGAGASPSFRFHLVNEPSSLKAWEQKNSAAGYLLSQVTGTLLIYQNQTLKPNLASSCRYQTPKKIRCVLRKKLQWSDGSALTAADFVRGFQEFLDPRHHAFRADLLFPLKNAEKIFKGELPLSQLGASSSKENQLDLELEQADSEFLFTLTSPLLAPLPASGVPSIEEIRAQPGLYKSSGAYQFQSWEVQKKITLIGNSHFWKKSSERPSLEILAVSEDSVALNLFEKGELSFLRRLPTLFVAKYKGKPEYVEVDQFRLDYLAFSDKWKNQPLLRQALALSLNYSELQTLYAARPSPGCPGLPAFLHKEDICHRFQLSQAQALWRRVDPKPKTLSLTFSKQGGDDIKRGMEWAQSTWKKNLGLDIEVTAFENKVYVEKLEQSPSDIFRKGVAPDRPTCLAALETFATGNSENYLRYSQPAYDALIQKMRITTDLRTKKKLCDQALHLLMDEAWIIPTGPIHFTLLVSPSWQGWKLNELNQLDLTDLKFAAIETPKTSTK